MIPYGSMIVFVTPKGRRYIKKLTPGGDWHSNEGILSALAVSEADFGFVLKTSLGTPIRLEEATLFDRLMGLKRQTQIIYPKDIAYICLKLGAGPGKLIVEAGCGSGGLTAALSWFCGPSGKIISHDAREEFVKLARKNLDWAELGANVDLHCHDITNGFLAQNADALFLDVREPWLYLDKALQAVRPGAMLAFLLPTTNQVSQLLLAMESQALGEIEVCEILVRNWKPVPDRLRPADRMTAHTSFLVFCRQQEQSAEFDNFLPKDTRERKENAARENRNNGASLAPGIGEE